MKIKLAYDRECLDIDLLDGLDVDVLEPGYVEALPDQAAAIEDALLSTIDSRPLREIVKRSDTIA